MQVVVCKYGSYIFDAGNAVAGQCHGKVRRRASSQPVSVHWLFGVSLDQGGITAT